jgi:uncharacterized membrane protein
MHSGLTTNAIIHQLSLAVAYGGGTFANVALKNAVMQGVSDPKERGKVMDIAWTQFNKVNVPAHVAFTATWLVERKAIKTFFGDQTTRKLVGVKDALVAGALITGVANTIAGEMLRREYPEGLPLPAIGNISNEKAQKLTQYMTYFRVMGPLNHALIGASIAIGPVIGSSVIRSSARSLLTRLLQSTKR